MIFKYNRSLSKSVSGHQCVWRMLCFSKTSEMAQIGVWPWGGVDFKQVLLPALQLLKGQGRTGQSGGGEKRGGESVLSAVTSRSQLLALRLKGWSPPALALHLTPLPRSLPYSSLAGMCQDNRTVPVLRLAPPPPPLGPTQALTGGQKCTLHLLAPAAAARGEYLNTCGK